MCDNTGDVPVGTTPPRPAQICAQLLQAMDASEGRRKRRKRNTTPDALGMELKRGLLEAVVASDPEPDQFEAWLFSQVAAAGGSAGAARALALQVRDEWEFAVASAGFRDWLAAGAPSDDSRGTGPAGKTASRQDDKSSRASPGVSRGLIAESR